ncbi:MAG TPA: SDR family oxidoreductase [Candidatus Dormibacteraeota bacterium]|nr:SDR family oxidoreductase [Candidatus Dormibacteraeota bacterium]
MSQDTSTTTATRDLFQLTDKVALITGGSRGIGRSIAEEYARRGAKVVITARKSEELEDTAAAIRGEGGQVTAVTAHASREEAVDNMIEQTMDAYGRIDILVNNAATNVAMSPFKDLPVAAWDKTIELNLRAPFVISQKVVNRTMEKTGGSIINMCSVASFKADPMMAAYNVSKAGLMMLTKVMARELGPMGIRVNGIAPAVIKTQFSRVLYETDSIRERAEQASALGRVGEWNEVAGAAVFLASDAASYVSGSIISVDGGTLA